MTPTPTETVLTFARVCMGWEDAEIAGRGRRLIRPSVSLPLDFFCTDLENVLQMARAWCDGQIRWLQIVTLKSGKWQAEIGKYGHRRGMDGTHSDPCQAIMLACVAAAERGQHVE